MKFGRYLNDTLTPEWKKAYINYRFLKKRIASIRRARDAAVVQSPISATQIPDEQRPFITSYPSLYSLPLPERVTTESVTLDQDTSYPPAPDLDVHGDQAGPARDRRPSLLRLATQPSTRSSQVGQGTSTSRVGEPGSGRIRRRSLGGSRGALRQPSFRSIGRRATIQQPFGRPITLQSLIPLLEPRELSFLTALDVEFDKIESFYLNREREMLERSEKLKAQIQGLADHRERFYAAKKAGDHAGRWSPFRVLKSKSVEMVAAERFSSEHTRTRSQGRMEPDEYQQAKKALKQAIIEHYRGLEALNNYRILNVTGIRKALKKFEKTTRIPAQEAYMVEKVDRSAFASHKTVSTMMKEMECLYAAQFVHGDKKKAMTRLRSERQPKSHHFSSFRSGVLLGLAVPAFVSGFYQSFQGETRAAIPGWDGLLLVYAILLVPVLFSVLVGVNLLAWSRTRINYAFIFGLDVRTRLDHREYFEIPNFLLATLCYAFSLSFMRIWEDHVPPRMWPLIWLGLVAVVLVNPLPVLFRSSRNWFARHTGHLLLSGARRVEFTDFWLGDQYCSLIFTLGNLPLVACSYAAGFDDWKKTCGNGSHLWGAAFGLAAIPLAIRLMQSVRRFLDSRLATHLINGGKYALGIIAYFFYFQWRHQGGRGNSFALWCSFNTVYALYAGAWDLLMDWSLLQIHTPHPMLREELLYDDCLPFYYLAIVSNMLIRFIWVIYIPSGGLDIYLRNFIVAVLEMLRRWQWNFLRLENEHLGNMDQYRITREVPLPYSFDSGNYGDDDENGD